MIILKRYRALFCATDRRMIYIMIGLGWQIGNEYWNRRISHDAEMFDGLDM